jgi:thiosulfate/3-mercaptopyruvate sulfurtransferase
MTTKQLAADLDNRDNILLDVRPIAAYNGWRLEQEPRGGHIRGATTFPLIWTNNGEWLQLLSDKGINREGAITVYGYDNGDAEDMAEKLARTDFEKVRIYKHFKDEWSPDDDLPLEHLPGFKQLIYPEWLKDLLKGKKPPTYDGNDYVICHASYRYRADYESGHVPGAIHLDTESLESSKTWNRRSLEEIEATLLKLGIRHDTMVVVYGRFNHPNNKEPYPGRLAGHLAAMRCAVILMYAGVRDVRILNGGFASWRDAGYEISTEEGEIRPAGTFGARIPAHPEYFVDLPEAKQMLTGDDSELVSIRSWDEFIGDVSGYDYIDKVGRIPGAVFGNCGSDAYHMENYRNIDHTIREHHEVADIWADTGVTPDKHIAFYCGTGWRASEAFINAYLMGWPRISVYDGGWFEWSSHPDNPVETGIPAGQKP